MPRCPAIPLSLLLVFPFVTSLLPAAESSAHYLGPETCALCHKALAAKQTTTAMANTWQGTVSPFLPSSFQAFAPDDPAYTVARTNAVVRFSVDLGDGRNLSLPVSASMGGQRHGLGFLLAIESVEGSPLARPTLVQARYAWSPEKHTLLLAPGCVPGKPANLESALGLVLSPTFASRCFECHGKPGISGSGPSGGVHCESCHGPGSSHLSFIAAGTPSQGITNPRRLGPADSMAICARCHVGLTKFSDPGPQDLLIANQVRAIQSSECYIQSRQSFTCTTCHDPHRPTPTRDSAALAACLGCHSAKVQPHAAICPVSSTEGCIACHMPSVDRGPLHLVDHQIRVHPETQPVLQTSLTARVEPASTIPALSAFLRICTTTSLRAATSAHHRLESGESFYKVARELSSDSSAPIGGYLGRKNLSDLAPSVQAAVAHLRYGGVTPVLQHGDQWTIYQRLPRDFRQAADALQNEAEALLSQGNAQAAIEKAQEALKIYPHFLRALTFVGTTFAQSGNPKKGVEVLSRVTRLYPEDAVAAFALAASFNALGEQDRAAELYRRVLALEEDFTDAYLQLGLIACARQDWQSAITTFRRGLQVDPLSAPLSYNLGLALIRSGDSAAGNAAQNLARKLDPAFATRAALR